MKNIVPSAENANVSFSSSKAENIPCIILITWRPPNFPRQGSYQFHSAVSSSPGGGEGGGLFE